MKTQTAVEKRSDLELKVLSVNTLFEYAQKCVDYEVNHFKQFLGKDIFKVDGTVKAKYDHERLQFKDQLPDGTFVNVHYWFSSGYDYFDIHIKSCISGGSYLNNTYFCIYEDTTYTMFKISDGGLLAENTERYNNDYSRRFNAEEIQKQARKLTILAEFYRNAYDEIPHYFREVANVKRLSY